jgi:hypothetical protein
MFFDHHDREACDICLEEIVVVAAGGGTRVLPAGYTELQLNRIEQRLRHNERDLATLLERTSTLLEKEKYAMTQEQNTLDQIAALKDAFANDTKAVETIASETKVIRDEVVKLAAAAGTTVPPSVTAALNDLGAQHGTIAAALATEAGADAPPAPPADVVTSTTDPITGNVTTTTAHTGGDGNVTTTTVVTDPSGAVVG